MFEQYKLPFSFDALEPVIDALTVETHWAKHHAAYTKAFNDFAQKAGLSSKSAEEILASLDDVKDTALQKALRNNGGGYYNHNLYFSTLSPKDKAKKAPDGVLGEKIKSTFGSFDEFKEKISALALSQFGSGWAWLSAKSDGSLVLSQSANQDNPISLGEDAKPIFCIDVWEHAYYLKYKNLRASYVKELFDIVDWAKVEDIYSSVLK